MSVSKSPNVLLHASLLMLALAGAGRARAQVSDTVLTVTPSFHADDYVAADTPVALELNRWPAPAEGQLVITVGTQDMTALFDRVGSRLVFRARGFLLPAGEHAAVIYLVSADGWREVARLPIKVLTPHGFKRAAATPAVAFTNKGQLAEGHSGTAPAPERAEYQDLGGTFGFQSAHARGAWTLQAQLNVIGVSNRNEALRFGELGAKAPRFDLSDFMLRLERPGLSLTAGHISFGASRHLIDGFASRGLTAQLARGRASLSIAGMNGSSIVGTDNLFGISNADHRMLSANLGVELFARRPGALQLNLGLLDAAALPATGFSAGGVVDAETSEGASLQVSASTASQRLTFGAGYTTSRFENTADAELGSDIGLVKAPARRKAARFGELSIRILENAKVLGALNTTLNAGLRHERVEPQFRSVAASAQADIEHNAIDLTGTVDAINFQLGYSRSRDNLDDVASILTTESRNSTAQLNAGLAALFRMQHGAEWWPTIALTLTRVHQAGAGIPVNADFQASHVPDQVSWMRGYSAQWQHSRWRFSYQHNRSRQDNRQAGRERSDLTSRINMLNLGVMLRSNLDIGVEGGIERQENLELTQIARLWRSGVNVDWRVTADASVNAATSFTKSHDEPRTSESENTDLRLEISHRFDLLRNAGAAKRGQVFLRFARQGADLQQFGDPALTPLTQTRGAWTLASGLNFRLF